MSSVTAFGAAWADPVSTCSILRATAWARQVPLSPLSDDTSAACVVAAHLWCVAAERSSLSDCSGLPLSAVETAAVIACAAAGEPVQPGLRPSPPRLPFATTDRLLVAVEEATAWAESASSCYYHVLECAGTLLRACNWPPAVLASQLCEQQADDCEAHCAAAVPVNGTVHG